MPKRTFDDDTTPTGGMSLGGHCVMFCTLFRQNLKSAQSDNMGLFLTNPLLSGRVSGPLGLVYQSLEMI